MGAVHQVFVFPMLFSFLPFGVLWQEFYLYKPVELGKQGIGEDRAEDTALRYAAQCSIQLPILHMTCVEELFDEVEKPAILDVRKLVLR